MFKYILIFVPLFLLISFLAAQENYKGKYDGETPVKVHKMYDDDGQIQFKLKYSKKGLIRSIKTYKGEKNRIFRFPETLDEISWEEITDGLWINQAESSANYSKEFPGDYRFSCHYAGYLTSGKSFDNSFTRNKVFSATLQRLVKGFSLGIWNIKKGEARVIKMAPELGYGEKELGPIPANSTLLFYIYRIE